MIAALQQKKRRLVPVSPITLQDLQAAKGEPNKSSEFILLPPKETEVIIMHNYMYIRDCDFDLLAGSYGFDDVLACGISMPTDKPWPSVRLSGRQNEAVGHSGSEG